MEELKIILKREVQEIILETSVPVDQETITKMAQQTICTEVCSCAPLAYILNGASRVWLITIPLRDMDKEPIIFYNGPVVQVQFPRIMTKEDALEWAKANISDQINDCTPVSEMIGNRCKIWEYELPMLGSPLATTGTR